MLDLTPKEYEELWDSSQDDRAAQRKRQNYFEGKHAISGANETYVDGSDKSERVTNWLKFGVNMYVGALTAQEYSVTPNTDEAQNEGILAYGEIVDDNNLHAVDVVNLRNALLKGYGLECYHLEERGEINITACDPLDWHLVYDSNGELLGAIYRSKVMAGQFHNGDLLKHDTELMVVYDDTSITSYERSKAQRGSIENARWVMNEEMSATHPFGVVPVNVVHVAESMSSYITDDLLGQMDEYNEIDSMSGDDIRYDADGVFAIKGYSAENVRDNAKTIRETKTLPLPTDGSAEFIQKRSDTARVESRLKRTREHIFAGLAVPDVESILGATGTTSGIALRLKFKPMIENANTMITHLRRAVRRRIDIINTIRGILGTPVIEDYRVNVSFSLPVNRVEEWQNINSLDGTVSLRTRLELLSDIKNPTNELERLRKEAEDAGIIAENSGTPEEVGARVDQQIAEQVPNMQELISGVVDAISDAALTVAVQRNNTRAVQAEQNSDQ